MPRNYTLPTIKTLFGEATACAYPGCTEPLIFRDRGVATVVTQVAHIRSERPGGPRHDPKFAGDVNGVDNLLLLCGRHHPPVDRHESIYSVEELEAWKRAQRASANGGTAITDDEARQFVRLGDQERHALAEIARMGERVISAAERAHQALSVVVAKREAARRKLQTTVGPVYSVDDDGESRRIDDQIRLPRVDEERWRGEAVEALSEYRPAIEQSVSQLKEEAAVLRMMGGLGLNAPISRLILAAKDVLANVGDESALGASATELTTAVSRLWASAHGEESQPE